MRGPPGGLFPCCSAQPPFLGPQSAHPRTQTLQVLGWGEGTSHGQPGALLRWGWKCGFNSQQAGRLRQERMPSMNICPQRSQQRAKVIQASQVFFLGEPVSRIPGTPPALSVLLPLNRCCRHRAYEKDDHRPCPAGSGQHSYLQEGVWSPEQGAPLLHFHEADPTWTDSLCLLSWPCCG